MKLNIKLVLSFSVMAGFMFLLNGCSTVPAGASRSIHITTGQLQASGAGILTADTQTTTFRVKCKICGYESEPITIPTPQAGKPYILHWTCPSCGHKQTITIKLV
jgi:ribosomal protein S27E